jgi:pyridoxal 5'-phosphate synthase glutaminase subunit Pdx2
LTACFVGSGIFKSGDPARRAKAIVEATTHYRNAEILARVSENLGEPMVGIGVHTLAGAAAGRRAAGDLKRTGEQGGRGAGEILLCPCSPAPPLPCFFGVEATYERLASSRCKGPSSSTSTSLRELGVAAVEVRLPEELEGLDGLIIPGGESTTIGKLADAYGLTGPLRDFAAAKPVWGTCAGMIFMAKEIGRDQPLLGLMNIEVERNAFGRQVDSFITPIDVDGLLGGEPFPAVFIRGRAWWPPTAMPALSPAWPTAHPSPPKRATGWRPRSTPN